LSGEAASVSASSSSVNVVFLNVCGLHPLPLTLAEFAQLVEPVAGHLDPPPLAE
jgi:hypothetical protein